MAESTKPEPVQDLSSSLPLEIPEDFSFPYDKPYDIQLQLMRVRR